MQKEGKVRFLKYHEDKPVKSVSFNPKERYIFCSCASDGKINIYGSYNSSFHYLLASYPLTVRDINAVRFSGDGRCILAALSTKKLAILDVERGSVVNIYDDCCFSSNNREFVRIPIRTDPTYPYLSVTLSRNGRGVGFLDARMPLPLHFLCDLHSSDMIRDIVFLNDSWPFVPRNNHAIATITHDGNCKVTTLDGSIVQNFEVGHKTNSLAATPERFDLLANSAGYRSSITFGGDYLSHYLPEPSASPSAEKVQATRTQNGHSSSRLSSLNIPDYYLNRQIHFRLNQISSTAAGSLSSTISIHPPIHASIHSHLHPIQSAHSQPSASIHPPHSHLINSSLSAANSVALVGQANRRVSGLINTAMLQDRISLLKYGSNGGLLYAVTNSNHKHSVQRFRRYPNDHRLLGELYSHKAEIYDIDVSAWDEFVVTASKDQSVGIKCLGSPNHDTTSISELT